MATIALLLTFLSPTLAFEDVSISAHCFPKSEQVSQDSASTVFHAISSSPHISIEIQDWTTHRLNTRIAEILLREKLGFKVEVRRFVGEEQSSRAAYIRLGDRQVDLNVEVWPHFYQSLRDDLRRQGNFILGQPTGFLARTGWYLSKDSLPSLPNVSVAYASVASGSGVSPAVELNAMEFMRALPYAAQTLLVKARNLSRNDVCNRAAVQGNETDGVYNCTDGTWTRRGIGCAPRSEPLNGRLPCPALLTYDPDQDGGQIEARMSAMKLDLEVVYEPNTELFVQRDWTQPLLIHNYEPSPLVTGSGLDFLRVEVANGVPVGFPVQEPELVISLVYLRSESHKTMPAKYLTERFTVTNSDILKMQRIITEMSANRSYVVERYGDDVFYAAACEWLRDSPTPWSDWLRPAKSAMAWEALIALVVMVVAAVYTLDGSYRFYFGRSMLAAAAQKLLSLGKAAEAPAKDGTSTHTDACAESPSWSSLVTSHTPTITLAQESFSCHVSDGEVSVELLRFGDAAAPAVVTVTTEDGQYAAFGRHYMEIRADGSPYSGALLPRPYSIFRPGTGDTSKHPARTVEVRFKPGKRSAVAKVVIADVKQVAAVREFSVKLIGARNAADGAPISCTPITASTVRIHDTMRFPNGYKLRFPHPPMGEYLVSADDALRKIFSLRGSSMRSSGSGERRGFRYYCRMLLDRLALARHFTIAMAKFERHWTLWWHIQQIFNAATNFTDSLLFAYLINYVLGDTGHPNWGYTLAFLKLATFWLKYRVFHFVPPTYSTMIDLKNLLTRKLLSLSDKELQAQPQLESRYLHAITTSSEKGWLQTFNDYHALYFATYANISSVAYILYTISNSSSVKQGKFGLLLYTLLALPLVLILQATIHLLRVKRQMDYGVSYDRARQAAASCTYHICRDWRLIRLYGIEAEVSRQASGLRGEFNGQDFWMWLYSVRTTQIASTAQELIVCCLWGLAYYMTVPAAEFPGDPVLETGDFLTVLSNFAFFSNSIDRFMTTLCGYSGLLRTSFKIEEVADLLNVGLDSNTSESGMDTATAAASGTSTAGLQAFAQFSEALDRSDGACRIGFIVQALTFVYVPTIPDAAHQPIFDRMSVVGAIDGQYLPNGLIGLRLGEEARRTSSSLFAAQAEATFLDLLAGACQPSSGVCTAVPKTSVVPVIAAGLGSVVEGTLLENLYFAGSQDQHLSEEQLWQLCRYIGLSEVLLGECFQKGWSKLHVSSIARRLSGSDLFKLMLARALVRRPKVLLVGGAISLADQEAIAPLLYAFLDGSLDETIHGNSTAVFLPAHRAVVWSASEQVLSRKLRQTDYVLTLESPECAKLTTAKIAFAHVPEPEKNLQAAGIDEAIMSL